MAYLDYKHCFICDSKAYYDAHVDYPDVIEIIALCSECCKSYTLDKIKKEDLIR
jgi:hypothetical protein